MTLILGRKRGMTQFFEEDGKVVPVTIVEAGPCVVTQVRNQETDGYDAIQLGFEDIKDSRAAKPQRIHCEKAKTAPKRFLRERRLDGPAEHAVGDAITVEAFEPGQLIDVTGTSKGRGFSGTIKRHGFSRGAETHGCMNVRQPGAIGACAYPGRVFKGTRMSGHFGAERTTAKNLKLVRVDAERGLLFVRGSVPGPNGGFVQVRTAKTGMPAKG
ncbi:50S ribosomal protein L3 [Planctomycetes bacterium Pla163]|uniref:Large ribosomal subunit protein uL3 n=1 Tax=Rohdeia mirabilis TaxID=2528008 RepID=A0A518D2T0_9BACT|nr:50S ribosomal protein L3 [Planctomycetes bacterium Pla163]